MVSRARLRPLIKAAVRSFIVALVATIIGVAATMRGPVLAAAQSGESTPQDHSSATALVVEYDGIIHPIAAEFLDEAITRADTSGARVLIVLLRTPGGLLDSTRTMVSRMIAAKTPIVVFVAPSGSRAASAGFLLTLAADVAVMAPGTHIGAAHPVSATGGEPGSDTTMAKKATEDAAAYARTLAQARGRNATLAAEAVTESRAFTEREALEASPPLIDFIATDVDDVLRQLHGRTITRFNGTTVVLNTRDLSRTTVEMSRRQQFLAAIAHPQIAYLLLSLGSLGLIVELWNPGSILPGVAGGLCLLLAFFAFQVIPVNAAGILLIVFGVAMLVLELKVPSFGTLGIGGTIALLIGSVMITREVPGVEVSYGLIVPAVLTIAGLMLFLGRLALRAQRQASSMGPEALLTEVGHALTTIGPGGAGQVRVHGEIWRAVSDRLIAPGTPVRIAALRGLTVHVEPMDSEVPTAPRPQES